MDGISDELESERAFNRERETVELIGALADALVWCSGSYDFAPEGKAGDGWANFALPRLNRALAWLQKNGGSCRPEAGPTRLRTMEKELRAALARVDSGEDSEVNLCNTVRALLTGCPDGSKP
jgi:hypothetical protein